MATNANKGTRQKNAEKAIRSAAASRSGLKFAQASQVKETPPAYFIDPDDVYSFVQKTVDDRFCALSGARNLVNALEGQPVRQEQDFGQSENKMVDGKSEVAGTFKPFRSLAFSAFNNNIQFYRSLRSIAQIGRATYGDAFWGEIEKLYLQVSEDAERYIQSHDEQKDDSSTTMIEVYEQNDKIARILADCLSFVANAMEKLF